MMQNHCSICAVLTEKDVCEACLSHIENRWNQDYRQLKKGELLEEGDELNISLKEGVVEWAPITYCIGEPAPDPRHWQHRRKVKPD